MIASHRVLVARDANGGPLGFIAVRQCDIAGFYVAEGHRGQGIGRALLERCAHAARAIGADLIILVGDEPYYGRHGYKRVPPGRIRLPGPVDPMRLLGLELKPGALSAISGDVRGG